MDSPLAGVRVLDLTRLLPGAYCTLRLAGLGADVIKVEEPGRGDYLRDILPELFTLVNRGKRSIELDLKTPAGAATLRSFAAGADVLVESFRPGTLERLVGDPRAGNPRLILCSLSGYGADGPYRDWPGHDVNYLSIAGYLGLQRRAGEDPVLPVTPLADMLGGMEAAMAVLGALLSPERGATLRLSLFEAARTIMLLPLGEMAASGAGPEPSGGLLTGGHPGYGVYRTADGRHLGLGALEPKFWEALCTGLGRTDLIALRDQDAVACNQALRSVIAAQPLAHWVGRLPSEACATPVLTIEEALQDPQVRAMGLLDVALGSAPTLGQHTEELLRELGL
ncbi:MAG TPA: CaiB/BaiF CoA-transferase family protein [Bacillota bacterium]|nr:CaiB/BaiF CoA-transferase family protein [Bacillota bacterium]